MCPAERKDLAMIASMMIDHPSWLPAERSAHYRAVRVGTDVWALTCIPAASGGFDTGATRITGRGARPFLDVIDPASLSGPKTMIKSLCSVGAVGRWRNPDLWDALGTSIIRQVIRAGQARKLYRAFCRAHGEVVATPLGPAWLFPTPSTLLDLPDAEFAQLGLAFKRRALRAAADAVLEFGAKWTELTPSDLLAEVQTVPRIGPWTAGATVADLTNDYALYPYADLAVRTWAKRLAPGRSWPETEPEFARMWARLAGDQLSEWTLLTLAWGVRHAHAIGGAAL